MKIIPRDVNKWLLVLIIIFLVIFTYFTVYYENTLRNIIYEKNLNEEKFSKITAQLILEKLNKTDKLNEIALIDKAVLEERYNDLIIQNQKLKNEIITLKNEITLLKSQSEYHQVKIDGPVAQFRLIQKKNDEIKTLKELINTICQTLQLKNISMKECENNLE